MKISVMLAFTLLILFSGKAQIHTLETGKVDTSKKFMTVQTACGECKFNMEGPGCDLAIKMDNHFYFVDGIHIDSLGDAHADDGFCKAVRKAEVQAEIRNGRFVATYMKLYPGKLD